MDVNQWLAARPTQPPEKLASRIQSALADVGATTNESLSDQLADAAGAILRKLADEGATERAVAIDLLAADALITYAVEAAAEECSDLSVKATEIIARVSRR